jgi:hypothetical protein
VLPPSESPGQKLTTSQVLVMLTNTSFAIICVHSMVFCFVTESDLIKEAVSAFEMSTAVVTAKI